LSAYGDAPVGAVGPRARDEEGRCSSNRPGRARRRPRVAIAASVPLHGPLAADAQGAADFDLELIESRTLDGHTQELSYRPTLHV
jgi:hypothetical protein